MRALALALALLLLPSLVWAQSAPSGTAMVNVAIAAKPVVKSDTTVLTPTRALWVGDATACALAVTMREDLATGRAAVTFSAVPPGSLLPLQVSKVMSTNTTCATVIALW